MVLDREDGALREARDVAGAEQGLGASYRPLGDLLAESDNVVMTAPLTDSVRRRLADRASLVLWLGIPLMIGGVMSLAIGGDGGAAPRAQPTPRTKVWG